MSQKRSVGKCFGCGEEAEIVTHQKTMEFPGGDPDKPLCSKCNMRGRKVSPKASQCRRIKAATQAMLSLDPVIEAAPEEDRQRFRDMQDHLMHTINAWSSALPAQSETKKGPTVVTESSGVSVAPADLVRLAELREGNFFLPAPTGKNDTPVLHYLRHRKTNGNVTALAWNGSTWTSEQTIPHTSKATLLTNEEAEKLYPGMTAPPMSPETQAGTRAKGSTAAA